MMKAISILSIGALAAISAGCSSTRQSVSATGERYPWKKNIVTTVFWIGEKPSGNNPVPNRISSWDKNWSRSYGGFDDPNPAHRQQFDSRKVHASTEPVLLRPPIQRQGRALAIDRKRPASFHGSRKRTKAPAFPPARIDGLRFARGIERFMRNGKTQDPSALIIGSMYLAMNVRKPL